MSSEYQWEKGEVLQAMPRFVVSLVFHTRDSMTPVIIITIINISITIIIIFTIIIIIIIDITIKNIFIIINFLVQG